MSKFIRIDMTLLETSSEDAGTEYDLSGGRGLIARLLNDEVDPLCGPLESGNLLVFCTGVLAGTAAPTSSRLSVGAKSPLTGGIKEANAGGTFGRRLADYNIKAIIIEGKPLDEMIYIIHISEAGVQVLPADDYRGLNNYELVGRLAGCFGTDISVASIGVAGERGYHNSTVQVTDMEGRPARAAARGGLGAVMGSKGIKAVVIDRPSERITPEYEDGSAFREACRNYIRGIKANPTSGMAMPALGTAVLVNPVNAIGALPVNNFSSGQFADAERISGEMLSQIQNKRGGSNGHGCQPGCPIRCSNVYMDESGSYLTSGFEFETIALNGSNLGISNLDVIAGIDRICDDLGIDTMETGCTMGVCMEAGLISFGDEDGVFSLLSEMADGTDRGRLLAMGAAECGKKLGVERVPAVKNQAMAAYDPRALKGHRRNLRYQPYGSGPYGGKYHRESLLFLRLKERVRLSFLQTCSWVWPPLIPLVCVSLPVSVQMNLKTLSTLLRCFGAGSGENGMRPVCSG